MTLQGKSLDEPSTLRLYLGELDSEFITVPLSKEQRQKLIAMGKANFDDGGVLFTEIIMTYQGKTPLTINVNL